MSAKHSYLGHAELFLSDNLRLTTTTIYAVAFVMEQFIGRGRLAIGDSQSSWIKTVSLRWM